MQRNRRFASWAGAGLGVFLALVMNVALAHAWEANEEFANLPVDKIKKLAREKYSTREWNYKF